MTSELGDLNVVDKSTEQQAVCKSLCVGCFSNWVCLVFLEDFDLIVVEQLANSVLTLSYCILFFSVILPNAKYLFNPYPPLGLLAWTILFCFFITLYSSFIKTVRSQQATCIAEILPGLFFFCFENCRFTPLEPRFCCEATSSSQNGTDFSKSQSFYFSFGEQNDFCTG